MARLIGKTTINPFIFYTGKISGYVVWILFFIHFFYNFNQIETSSYIKYTSYFIFFIGTIITAISIFNLGKSTSLGIPKEKTTLKNKGLYKISRNPMYLGFNLATIASILLTLNIFILALGLYSLLTYHLIILGEEKFLKERFGKEYMEYCKKVRRYI